MCLGLPAIINVYKLVWLLEGNSEGIPGATQLKWNYQSKEKKKKPKENAKQYKISGFTSEFNMF